MAKLMKLIAVGIKTAVVEGAMQNAWGVEFVREGDLLVTELDPEIGKQYLDCGRCRPYMSDENRKPVKK